MTPIFTLICILAGFKIAKLDPNKGITLEW